MFILILKDYVDDETKECILREPQIFLKYKHLLKKLFKEISEQAYKYMRGELFSNYNNPYSTDELKFKIWEFDENDYDDEKTDKEHIYDLIDYFFKGQFVKYIFDYEIFEIKK